LLSNLHKHQDELHLHVYDDDVIGRDSIGSAKINLKKHVFGKKSRYEQWIRLPAHLGLGSHGEVHVIIEHLVLPFFLLYNSINHSTLSFYRLDLNAILQRKKNSSFVSFSNLLKNKQ